jgi:hypothetical protein
MPVLKKEIELDDGRKVWVRQASGLDKLKIEAKQGRAMRKCRHFGPDPSKWSDEQMEEFLELCDKEGAGFEHQVEAWLPNCLLDKDVDPETLTSEELVRILNVIRGDDNEGAVPLD